MTNEKYDSLVEKLEKANIDITRNALFEHGTKRKANCSVLFAAEDVTEKEFLEEVGRRIDARAKEVAMNYDGPQGFHVAHQWRVVSHPSLQELPKVGESDVKIFQRIRFASDPINATIAMLVNTEGQQYKLIPMSSSKSSDMMKLSSILARTSPIGDKLQNYYEELMAITKAPFKAAVQQYNSNKIEGLEDFIEFISKHYPCSMLSVAYLKVLLEPVRTKILDNEGVEKETTVFVPRAATVAQGDSTLDYSPIKHLVDCAPMLAADPRFQISMPKVLTNNPDEPALKYIDLSAIIEEGDTPAWDELLSRYTEDEGKVLLAYLYGLNVAKNRSRQLLYIYDPQGYSAKSVMQDAVVNELGDDQVGILQKDSLSNQFGIAKIWNKHVIFIPDNKNPNLVRSEKMHMALGGDMAEVEYKGSNSFFAKLNMKVIACGNTALDIDTAATHERSRVIVLKPRVPESVLKKIAVTDDNGELVKDPFGRVKLKGDPEFAQKLKDEYHKMLFKAKKCYEELCPTDGDYILPDSVIRNIEECNDDMFDTIDKFVSERFEICEDSYVRPNDLREEFKCGILDKDITFKAFTDHLIKAYGVRKAYSEKAYQEEGNHNPVYVGLKVKV